MLWHLPSRKLFNTKIFALKSFSTDLGLGSLRAIHYSKNFFGNRSSSSVVDDRTKGGNGGGGGIRNKSGWAFCPLAQSIISAWKQYGKGSYFFSFFSDQWKNKKKKLVMLSFATVKFLKFCWWYLRSFPDIRNRSAVIIIIKPTMPYRIFHLYNTAELRDRLNHKNPIYPIIYYMTWR